MDGDSRMGLVARAVGVLVVVAMIWGGYRWYSARKTRGVVKSELGQELQKEEAEKRLEEKLKWDVPDEGEKAVLVDVSGGSGAGVARRVKREGVTEIEVLADLADVAGAYYFVWLYKGDSKQEVGEMRVAKGGYLVTKSFAQDLSGYDKVVVSLERVRDSVVEKRILEGGF